MITIGERITQLRKAKNWSQDELAKQVNSSRVMIGKYERADNLPSIEVIMKLAKAFDVSVDFLLGEGQNASFDRKMVQRMQEIESMEPEFKDKLFSVIDSVIRDYKTQKAYS